MCLANGLRSEILLGSFAMQAVKKKRFFHQPKYPNSSMHSYIFPQLILAVRICFFLSNGNIRILQQEKLHLQVHS